MTNENIPCNFHVGQKVVCINDDRAFNLRKGDVYTVSAVTFEGHVLSCLGTWHDVSIRLVEAEPNSPHHTGFDPARFRPAITRKTDISVFKAMLKPSKQRSPA